MKKVINSFMGVANTYMELTKKTERTKRSYNGIELFPSEIHTLVFIKDNSELNLTDMARKLGVTKGAIFKIIQKLEKKELLTRYKKSDNVKNTYFKITEKGMAAYEGHELFHKDFFCEPSTEFSQFIEKNEDVILKMFDFTKEYLSEHIGKIDEDN